MTTGVFLSQLLPFTITPTKADGSPGQVDSSSVVVASSDETVITIINVLATDTSISGDVNPVAVNQIGPDGNPIAVRFTVTADADLGPGVATITGVSDDISVTLDPGQMATTFTIALGAPVPKP